VRLAGVRARVGRRVLCETGGRPLGIVTRSVDVKRGVEPVVAPLPHVAGHVVEAEAVGGEGVAGCGADVAVGREFVAGAWKRKAEGSNLLQTFATGPDIPLFVSEGSAEQQRRAIRRSDYLDHVYATFEATTGRLVVFGHGLTDADEHLNLALREDPNREVACSIFPTTQHEVDLRRDQAVAAFPEVDFKFFDSRTHPLGDSAIQVL
jgi:hypothetical protein